MFGDHLIQFQLMVLDTMLVLWMPTVRHTWIFFLKLKSEVFKVFKQFKTVEVRFGKKIKAIQSDRGGEFRSLSTFLQSNGIAHRPSCPHTSHKNGVVERKHRTLLKWDSHSLLMLLCHFVSGMMLFPLLLIL